MEWKRDSKSNKAFLKTLHEFRGIFVSVSLPLLLVSCLPHEISVKGLKDKVFHSSISADLNSVPTPGDTSMNVSVGGEGVVSYIYKTGNGSLDCSDPSGYSSEIPVSTPITDPLGPDGTKKICIVATDQNGNRQPYSSATEYTWIKDTAAPTVSITSPAAGSYINTANASSFFVSGSCSVNGTNNLEITIGATQFLTNCSSGSWSRNLNLSGESDGPVLITVSQENLNSGAVGSDSRSFTKSTTLPSIAITNPAVNAYIYDGNRTSFTVSGTCDVASGAISVTGGSATVNTTCDGANWSANLAFADAVNATPTVVATIINGAGNTQSSSRTFTHDTVNPLLAISSPAAGSYINSSNQASFTVTGSCSDNGISNVVIEDASNATMATVNCSAGSWTANLDFSSGYPDGLQVIEAIHYDAAGNSHSIARSFNKATTLPAIAITAPAANAYIFDGNRTAFTVSGTCNVASGAIVITGASSSVNTTCDGANWTANLVFTDATNATPTVVATITDGVGNSQNDSRAFIHDTVNPVLAYSSPAAGSFINSSNQTSFTVSGTCSDNGTGNVVIEDSSDAVMASVNCSSGTWTANLDFSSGYAEGAQVIETIHMDAAGNTHALTRSFTKSTLPPSISITSPATNSYIFDGNRLAFAVSGTCNVASGAIVVTGASSNVNATCDGTNWSANLVFADATNATPTVTATLTDEAGNTANATRAFIHDTVNPTLAISAPAAGSFINVSNQASFTVSGTCSDDGSNNVVIEDSSNVVMALVNCNSNAWTANLNFSSGYSDGTQVIEVIHTDVAGNTDTVTRSFTKSTGLPVIAIAAPAANSYIFDGNRAAFTVSGTCDVTSGAISITGGTATVNATCDGTNWTANLVFADAVNATPTVTATITDGSGNTGSDSRAFIQDTVNPTLAYTTPAAGSYINNANQAAFTVSGTCTDDGTNNVVIEDSSNIVMATVNCSSGSWTANLDFSTGYAQGAQVIETIHTDAAGNTHAVTRSFTKSTILPSIAITAPAVNAYIYDGNRTAFSVSGTCNVTSGAIAVTGGAATVNTTCNGATWTANLVFADATNASPTVTATITDAAGNTEDDNRIFTHDTVNPTVAISAPAAGSYINSSNEASFAVSGTCSDNGTGYVMIEDSTSAIMSTVNCAAGAWSASLDFSGYADGAQVIEVIHRDAAGNTHSETRSFNKSTSLPSIAITAPAVNAYIFDGNRSSFTVSGTCSVTSGAIAVSGGSAVVNTTCDGSAWTANLVFADATNATPTVTATITDAASNTQSDSRVFTHDTVNPTLAFSTPSAGSYINSSNQASFTVTGTCSDDGTGNVVIENAANVVMSTVSCVSGSWTANLDFSSGYSEGVQVIEAIHTDGAGNTHAVTRSFTKETTLPSIAITAPAVNSYIFDGNRIAFTVSGTCDVPSGAVVVTGGTATVYTTCDGATWTADLAFADATNATPTVTASITDAAGNTEDDSRVFIHDTVNPVVAFSTPSSGSYINSSNLSAFVVTGTCSDNGTGYVVLEDASNSIMDTVNCSSGTWTASLNFSSGYADGSHVIEAIHRDAAGNTHSTTRSFTKATTLPAIAITAPVANAYIFDGNRSSFTVSGTCDVASGAIAVTGGTSTVNTICDGTNWTANLTFADATNATPTVTATITDGPGNVNSDSRAFIHDTVNPVLAYSTPSAGSYINSSNQNAFTVTGTCSDDGTNNVIVENSSNVVMATVNCSSGVWTANLDFSSGYIEGAQVIETIHTDAAGNTHSLTRSFTKSTTLPAIAINAPAVNAYIYDGNRTAFTLSGTCDVTSGAIAITGSSATVNTTCNGTSWTANLTFADGTDATPTVTATITDVAGNTQSATRTFIHDTVNPIIDITSPVAGTYINNTNQATFTISGTCTENASNNIVIEDVTSTVMETVDCSLGVWSASLDFSGYPDGLQVIEAIHTDAAGNTHSETISYNKLATLPAIAITAPAVNAYIYDGNRTAFTVSGTCDVPGAAIAITGGSSTVNTTCDGANFTANLVFADSINATPTVVATVTDAGGNTQSSSRAFIHDTVNPLIAITAPAVNAQISNANRSSFTVSGTCDEASGAIVVSGASVDVNTTCNGSTWTANLDFPNATNGSPTVTATLTDIAGNTQVASRSFLLDTVNPDIAFTTSDGTFITVSNQASFPIAGTCSENGQNVVIRNSSTTVMATLTCTAGAWSTSMNLSSYGQGTQTFTATHVDSFGNTSSTTGSFIKDTVFPEPTWAGMVDGVCVGTENENSFAIQGSCTNGDGVVTISSPQLSPSQTATCSGGTYSAVLNFDTTGLALYDFFNVQVSQTDAAGNTVSVSHNLKYIAATAPTIVFDGWDDVYAIGKKTYLDGNPSEPGIVSMEWKAWSAANTCQPEGVKVYRADSPGSAFAARILTSTANGVPPTTRSFVDPNLVEADFGKAWYYSLELRIAGLEYEITSPAEISEVRIIAPPDNMALVHRWITNQEVCGLMGLPTDPANHFRCAYTGQGNVGGYHDMEHDLVVDRFETGCNVSATCGAGGNTTCASQHFGNLENPSTGAGVAGTIGSVYYDSAGSARGRCWIKTGAANTAWSNLTSAVSSELAIAATNIAHAPPLVWLTRDMYAVACTAKSETIGQVVEYAGNSSNTASINKRLLRNKEWKAAAAWYDKPGSYPSVYTDSAEWIDHIEKSAFKTGDASGRVGKCNTDSFKGSLSNAARDYLGNFNINDNNFETGSKIATIDCQSRYGIQDMIGNVQEKISDELTCSGTDNKLCYGRTSSIDPGNTAFDGFAFDGVQGVNGSIITGDIIYYYGTHNTSFLNVVLGLPLRNNDGAGAIARTAWVANGKFHWDRFSYINTSITTQEAIRYGNLGGFFAYGNDGKYGRWYSSFMYGPTNAAQHMGGRCMLPVK